MLPWIDAVVHREGGEQARGQSNKEKETEGGKRQMRMAGRESVDQGEGVARHGFARGRGERCGYSSHRSLHLWCSFQFHIRPWQILPHNCSCRTLQSAIPQQWDHTNTTGMTNFFHAHPSVVIRFCHAFTPVWTLDLLLRIANHL